MLVYKYVLVFAAVASLAPAQPKRRPRVPVETKKQQTVVADPGVAWPIVKLTVEGERNIPAEEILSMSGLKLGQPAKKEDFDQAQERLLATGLFETVAYRYEPVPAGKGHSGTLIVKEIDQLYPYRFEELQADTQKLREWLRQKEPLFREKIPATEPVLQKFAEALNEYFAKHGPPIRVIGKLMPNDKAQLEVVFLPSELPAVAEVEFAGNKILTQDRLQQAVAGAGVGARYTENRFRQILDASVRPLYEAEGRLRVTFPKIELTEAKDVKGVIATVHVNEGEPYKLKEVRIAGPMAANKDLLKQGRFSLDETANMSRVREGMEAMEKSLRRNGYLHLDASLERTLDDKEKTVSVTIKIEPGPQFTMGDLVIEGLDIQTEPHIRKLWTLKAGEPFDAEYPDYFLSRIREDGIMDNLGRTRSDVRLDGSRQRAHVTLYFEGEKRPPKKDVRTP